MTPCSASFERPPASERRGGGHHVGASCPLPVAVATHTVKQAFPSSSTMYRYLPMRGHPILSLPHLTPMQVGIGLYQTFIGVRQIGLIVPADHRKCAVLPVPHYLIPLSPFLPPPGCVRWVLAPDRNRNPPLPSCRFTFDTCQHSACTLGTMRCSGATAVGVYGLHFFGRGY